MDVAVAVVIMTTMLNDLPLCTPSVEISPDLDGRVVLTIDVAIEWDRAPSCADLAGILGSDDWSQFPMRVLASSPQLTFDLDCDEGTILIRRGRPSVRCRLVASRSPESSSSPIEVTVMFFREDQWCGVAQRMCPA